MEDPNYIEYFSNALTTPTLEAKGIKTRPKDPSQPPKMQLKTEGH